MCHALPVLSNNTESSWPSWAKSLVRETDISEIITHTEICEITTEMYAIKLGDMNDYNREIGPCWRDLWWLLQRNYAWPEIKRERRGKWQVLGKEEHVERPWGWGWEQNDAYLRMKQTHCSWLQWRSGAKMSLGLWAGLRLSEPCKSRLGLNLIISLWGGLSRNMTPTF